MQSHFCYTYKVDLDKFDKATKVMKVQDVLSEIVLKFESAKALKGPEFMSVNIFRYK